MTMRLAFVSTIFAHPWGGADSLWTTAAEAAVEARLGLLLAVSPLTATHPRLKSLRASGARYHRRRLRADSRTRRKRAKLYVSRLLGDSSLTATLQHFSPDVVCICQGGTFDFLVEPDLMRWLEQAEVPYVLVCQSNNETFALSPDDTHKARHFMKLARAVVFVSGHNFRVAEQQLQTTLPNGIEIQNPPPRTDLPHLVWPQGPLIRLATVSRLEFHSKGLDLLIPALASALAHAGDWRLDLFGRGPDEAALRTLTQRFHLDDRVAFRGYCADVVEMWASHHLLLLPSRFEGCSLAMMEALLCGRPVVATPVGGVDEWIRDGTDGFVAPSIDEGMLAATIRKAWHSRDRWPEMGNAAHNRAIQRLDSEAGKKLLGIIQTSAHMPPHQSSESGCGAVPGGAPSRPTVVPAPIRMESGRLKSVDERIPGSDGVDHTLH